MENNFQVTVFIPTYNRLESLKTAVKSVLSQGDFVKLHVLDNASKDGTKNWLQILKKKEGDRVDITLRKENIGSLKNFSEGFASLSTSYAVPLADDDELLPNFLSDSLEIAKNNFDLGGVVFQTQVRSAGKLIHTSPEVCNEGRIKPLKHLQKWCSTGHYFSWSSILWNTELLHKINAKSEIANHGFFGDAWIQFLAFSKCDFYMIQQPGAVLNIHEDQCSQQFGPKFIEDMASILEAIEKNLNKRPDLEQANVKDMIRFLFINWNKMIEGQCMSLNNKNDCKEICELVNSYVKSFSAELFINSFGIIELFDQYKNIVSYNTKLKNEVDRLQSELSWMQNSFSWKITGPLRRTLTLLRKICLK